MSSSEAPDLQQQQEHDSSDEEYYDTGAGTGQEDEEEEHEGEALCQCEQMYQDLGNEKKVLYLLSIGLKGNNGPLFSLEQEPWSLLPKNSLRPKNNDYVKEITRRLKALTYNRCHVQVTGQGNRSRTGSNAIQFMKWQTLHS